MTKSKVDNPHPNFNSQDGATKPKLLWNRDDPNRPRYRILGQTFYTKPGQRKVNDSGWVYGSESDAAKALPSYELTPAQVDSRARFAKASATELLALKKARKDLKWNRLTLYAWRTHPELKGVLKYEDIPRRVILRLNKEFGEGSIQNEEAKQKKESETERYLLARAKQLRSRADNHDAKASQLMTHMTLAKLCELLVVSEADTCDDEEERTYSYKYVNPLSNSSKKKGLSPPDSILSKAQATRLRKQCLLVFLLLQAVADRDRKRSLDYELKVQQLSAKQIASKDNTSNKRTRGGRLKVEETLNAVLKDYLDECELEWKNSDTMPQLAERVVQRYALDPDVEAISAKTVLAWYNEFLRTGGFLENTQGNSAFL